MGNDYIAWCRYVGEYDHLTIETCNSDDEGAFKVYRHSDTCKHSLSIERKALEEACHIIKLEGVIIEIDDMAIQPSPDYFRELATKSLEHP